MKRQIMKRQIMKRQIMTKQIMTKRIMLKPIQCAILVCAFTAFSAVAARAQTDVALSLYGAFSGSTRNGADTQSPSNAAGGMIELRHISNPLLGYDVTYSYNRANQSYFNPRPCDVDSACAWQAISANAHELTGDWVASVHIANLRPFALAGVGLLFNQPAGSPSNSTSSTKPVFVYGAGLDWGLLPHLGLRFQYRGNLYKAPDLTTVFKSTNAFTQTAEPMIGAYLRF
jgi:opacity protein-like surface antigen